MIYVLQVATMLGACLTKDEVEEFMSEADVVRDVCAFWSLYSLHIFHFSTKKKNLKK